VTALVSKVIKIGQIHPNNVSTSFFICSVSDVFLLVLAPIRINLNETENKAVQALYAYPNIKIRHIDFSR